MTHCLKTIQPYYADVVNGDKTFEVRKDDRGFKSGDRILLQEWDEKNKRYVGGEWEGKITYVLRDPAFVKKGFIVFGIQELSVSN